MQLKVLFWFDDVKEQNEFQYLYGAVKRIILFDSKKITSLFQYLYGAVKSC
ncbi:hypothetical protein MODO_2619 [Myroides odoratimimus]|nr:hypothetical protein MODO_2619 [Myroides odoratimimus]